MSVYCEWCICMCVFISGSQRSMCRNPVSPSTTCIPRDGTQALGWQQGSLQTEPPQQLQTGKAFNVRLLP